MAVRRRMRSGRIGRLSRRNRSTTIPGWRCEMPKGTQKSNRETKKPKKPKLPTVPASPFAPFTGKK
jgi:hypothetical protein